MVWNGAERKMGKGNVSVYEESPRIYQHRGTL